MNNKPAILGVFAHPDDECYGPGGTLARYALEGYPVHILTFTRGEAGSLGSSRRFTREELACRREEELAAACRALGVAGHRIVGAPDGAVEGIGREAGAREVLDEIMRTRPQVLITFDEKGISGHADHRAVTLFTRIAYLRAGAEGPARIYEYGISATAAARLSLHRKKPILPIRDHEREAVIRVSDEAMDRKIEAIRRHRTQTAFYRQLRRAFEDYREATREELFRLVFERGEPSAGPLPSRFSVLDPEDDENRPCAESLFPYGSSAAPDPSPRRRSP
ncbi:MAG: PIG-L family deacetylase [Candidatus Eisenbacteria bacterium]|nr:PIG-L family deacetylase [Candidatus Eisenbacteria bacterium]